MKKQSSFQQTPPFDLRPASVEEAGLFYSNDERDEALGTVGHLRMDFGSGGKGFHHTWWPHNEDRFNTPEFKEALQKFVDAMRQDGPLKNLAAMNTYCWHNGGEIAENDRVYGFISETEHYRFCLRCTPRPGDYQGYLYVYDLRQQEMARQDKLVGRVSYASGEKQEFTDAGQYLQAIREELPYRDTTGFCYETLTVAPEVKKAVDDILLDFAGEENPRRVCNYGLTEAGKQALRDAADPSKPHTYSWFVMTDCNTSKEQIHRALTLDGAIQLYQDSDRPEKRLGVTKDEIATVDLVRFCDGEQQFFEDYRRLESFRDDPAISDAAETKRPLSQPLAFWLEEDILRYLKMTGIPYAPIYGDIVESHKKDGTPILKTTGVSRSGCMYCMYGVHLEHEPNRFQLMQVTHPRQYDYCINKLGCGAVLDYIGVPYRNQQLEVDHC